MKKYLLADVLSFLEVFLGLALIAMIYLKTPADLVIWVFVCGELCDAFDGICARRWPYPRDGKFRWWRVPRVVQAIEHTSDILILSALAFYLLLQTNPIIRGITLVYGLFIAGFSVGIEVGLRLLGAYAPEAKRRRLITVRRIIYLSGIAVGIVELIALATWPVWLKLALGFIGVSAGLALVVIKWDRFTETHETFKDFLRRLTQRQG